MPSPGHLYPLAGLADELQGRGHQVFFVGLPSMAEAVRELGFDTLVYGARDFSPQQWRARFQELGRLEGPPAMAAALELTSRTTDLLLSEGPTLCPWESVDLLVVDQLEYAGATLAQWLGRPYVTVCCSLMRNPEPGVPGYAGGAFPTTQADEAEAARLGEVVRPYLQHLNEHRQQRGLPEFSYAAIWSQLAQISQQPVEFEYPRRQLAECFHFTAPWSRPHRRPAATWVGPVLGVRPCLYLTLGTLQSRQTALIQECLEAIRDLSLQMVVSLGGAPVEEFDLLVPANARVFSSVPQLTLLKEVDLALIHGGLNTTLECLQAGVPMVVLPLAHDQPGVASRVSWTGTGKVLPRGERDAPRVREAVREVLQDPDYRHRCQRFGQLLAQRDGAAMAADVVEQVLASGGPVLRGQEGPVL